MTMPKVEMSNRNFRLVTILALSAFIITATMSGASGNNTLDAFAQSNASSNYPVGNTTTSGNITGG